MNKSRPLYAPFRLDLSGRAHLVVTDQPAPPEALETGLANIEVWSIATIAPGIEAPPQEIFRAFRAVPHLLASLSHRLNHEKTGLRLYAIGAESFLWDVHNLARAAGLGREEIHLTQAGKPTRRVYCTHCQTRIENVAQNLAPCPGCGAVLFVRDHFSRRLAAFMGVKVDAEAPGEIPEAEGFVA